MWRKELKEKKIYHTLVDLIKLKGTYRDKRHGHYVKLTVYDEYYLELDTWSSSISVYNSGGKKEYYLGIDFGGFNCDLTMVKFWKAHIK